MTTQEHRNRSNFVEEFGSTIKIYKIKSLEKSRLFILWRRPESNRCPNMISKSFLHAYFRINCREIAGTEPTNNFLS